MQWSKKNAANAVGKEKVALRKKKTPKILAKKPSGDDDGTRHCDANDRADDISSKLIPRFVAV